MIWASLVDDPSAHPEEFPTEAAQEKERQRLFRILEQLVKWENANDQRVLDAAKAEIMKSTDGNLPPLLDPFAGGGTIPLEAQRLGLEAHAHDLNPVAVMINKAMIEIPPKFAGQPPVNPEAQKNKLTEDDWLSKKRNDEIFVEPTAENGKIHYFVRCGKDVVDGTVARSGGVVSFVIRPWDLTTYVERGKRIASQVS